MEILKHLKGIVVEERVLRLDARKFAPVLPEEKPEEIVYQATEPIWTLAYVLERRIRLLGNWYVADTVFVDDYIAMNSDTEIPIPEHI